MSYKVESLLAGLGSPITVHIDQPIRSALDLMVLYDFSQLPVVEEGNSKDCFLVTSDSILAALADFGPQSYDGGLLVGDALKRVPQIYHASDDLFDLLEGMRDLNAALIFDETDGNLIHIVTSYDTSRYFRQWSESMMHARDIEQSLKQYLKEAFKFDNGEVDETSRQVAIESITSSNRELRKKFDRALRQYLKERSEEIITMNEDWINKAFSRFLKDPLINGETIATDESGLIESLRSSQILQKRFEQGLETYLQCQASAEVSLNENILESAFAELYNRNERPKEFKDLTLNEYIQLLFSDYCWPRCGSVLTTKESMKFMLEGVRDTRNDLAHFREDEINPQQRKQLKRCADWFAKKKDVVFQALGDTAQLNPIEAESRNDTSVSEIISQ